MTLALDAASTDLHQTRLFASPSTPAPAALTPRAAFQAALHGRLSLTDSRPEARRHVEGDLPAYLVHPGVASADIERDVQGGVRGWVAAGMPLAPAHR